MTVYKRNLTLFLMFFCALFVFGENLIWKTSVSSNTNGDKYYTEIKNALAEINLPKSADGSKIDRAGLRSRLENIQSGISKIIKEPYPSPKGHRAFGENGYIHSSPINLVLSNDTLKRMLDLIDQKSEK